MADIITRELGATAKNSPLTNAEVDNNFINLNEEIENTPTIIGNITEDMIGFENRTDSVISFDPTTRVFTLTPANTSFTLYQNGAKIVINSTKTITITDSNAGRYIKYNPVSETLEEIFTYPTFAEDILVAYIAWDPINDNAIVFGDERHTAARDTTWHRHQHLNVGAIWRSGGSISYTANSASAITVGIGAPLELLDEDITHSITHSNTPTGYYQQVLEGTAEIPTVYKDGAYYKQTAPATVPWLAPTAGGYLKYNPITNGTGALTDSVNNKYIVYWLVLTNDTKYPIKAFIGHIQHSTLDSAFSEAFAPDILSLPELAVMYQVVLSTGNYANSVKAVISVIRKAVAGTSYANALTPTDHGNLSGRSAANQHPIDAITGLQTALDGKEPLITKSTGYAKWNGSAFIFVNETYLQSYTETDPVFLASPAYTITSTNISNWNTAYNWGNHASAGYSLNGHTHVINDVTGLQTALDGKANINHSHTLNEVAITQGLTDPGVDRLLFWDDSANTHTYLQADGGLSITGTVMSVNTASTVQAGIVQLENITTSTSVLKAPTSNALKVTYDLANNAIPQAQKGAANGVATLDAAGVIPASQLPSFVDDVLEYNNLAAFPTTGETGKIYVAIDTNKTYRWSGSAYIYITSGAVDSVGGSTGVVTDTDLLTSIKRVDGSGSGLDADTVDGLQASAFYLASNPANYSSTTGTVTSVAVSAPTGLSVSGSPITTNGTFNITYASGYSLPTTAKQTNWDTAFGWGNHASVGYLTSVTWDIISNKPETFPPSLHSLESHSDVVITSNANGEILRWNGTSWVNNTLAEANIAARSLTLTAGTGLTGGGNLTANRTFSLDSTTVTSLANADTAFGWGNHASVGYALNSNIGVTIQGYSSILANTTASFTTADKTKLDGVAINANNYTLPTATSTILGGVEIFNNTVQSVASNTITSTALRTYGSQLNSDGQLVINVPWTDTTYSNATTSVSGLMASSDKSKLDGIAANAQVNVDTNLSYTTAATTGTVNSSTGTNATIPAATTTLAGLLTGVDKTKLDGIASGANNYSLPLATSTVVGGVELFSDTVQTVASNSVTTTASRTYGSQLNAAGQVVVNVPWVNTTYSNATTSVAGLMSAADKSKLDGVASGATANTGTVTSVGLTVPTGLSISGSPITTSGTLAVTFASGYSIPTTAAQTNWNTAFSWGNHASANYLSSSAIGVSVQGYSSVLQNTTASFTTTDRTKLDGIATNANNYSLPVATNTVLGGIEIFNNTVQSVAANTVTTVASRTYGSQLNSDGQLVVNVPWTDTTYSNVTTSVNGLMLATDKVKLDGIAAGAQVNVATNLGITAGTTAGPIVTSSTGTSATLPTATASASGVVTTGAQTWAGVKTFNSTITGSISGNAGTATALQTARTINGVSFNGSANITVTAANPNALTIGTGLSGTSYNGSGAVTVAINSTVATLTGTQTLTNKTAEKLKLNDGYTEEVFAITDGTTVNLDPNNGSIQTWTLGANRTPGQANWAAGQSIVLQIDDGSARTITWTTLAPVWKTNGGVAPTLNTSGFTIIVLWKVGTTIYGARVGDA
jgi:hypothetical protein